ncbi:MAG TPA: S8 family serine peptidase [Verrucomicrobiae bacterium]|nr:S8 family serine peptidase [Verrucomicrobiae bacterium]
MKAKKKTTAVLIAELSQDPDVETAEPNYLRWPTSASAPNDPFFPQLWGLLNTGQAVNGVSGTAHSDISFLDALPLARNPATNIVVAVIDTGIDYTHPDLAGNLWINPNEIPNNGVDDDGNGYVDDVHGFDFATGIGNPVDSGDHGTHVSGTIAATGDNGVGVIGVDSLVQIMVLKASANGSNFTDSALNAAVNYASMMRARGVNIVAINASYGGPGYTKMGKSAIQAAGNAGIVFCAAAGNDSLNTDQSTNYTYPASYRLSNMIVVAASDQKDALASFSNYGATTVDLAAPGVNILSTLPVWVTNNTVASVSRDTTTYFAIGLTYAGQTTGVTGLIYNCGLGYPTNFPPGVSNNIALIQRGTLFFSDKVSNAMTAGARAAIIYNNTNSALNFTLQTPGDWIPAVSISLTNGQTLLNSGLPATGVVVNAQFPLYQYLDGTSMATPHVAGAVAFAAANFPSETVTQRIQRILANVTTVSGLNGKVKTGGRLNLVRTVDADGNGLPDWWEQQHFNHLTGTDPQADPDADGLINRYEFYAGTNPANPTSCLVVTGVRWSAADGGFTITWPCAAGKTYQIQYADSPAGPWLEDLPNSRLTASSGDITLSYTDATGIPLPRRFYRVRLVTQ